MWRTKKHWRTTGERMIKTKKRKLNESEEIEEKHKGEEVIEETYSEDENLNTDLSTTAPLTDEQQQAQVGLSEKELPQYDPILSPMSFFSYSPFYSNEMDSIFNNQNDITSSSTVNDNADDFMKQKDYSVGYQLGYAQTKGTAISNDVASYAENTFSDAFWLGKQEGQKLDMNIEGDEERHIDRNIGKNMGFVAGELVRVVEPNRYSGTKYSALYRIGFKVGFWRRRNKIEMASNRPEVRE
eukprot:TRINITY_DN26093_c0_g1_i1.p1 TRINITY_DN26093_c0_g1~~TRINITY_DN26093_c0_g1_i1.p1  ORF type:complete len:241 (-),score=60.24 TRINITY_DN26093_c0_g1_i1:85-807(-)